MWKDMPPEEKVRWQNLAHEEERSHKAKYPDYKFTTKRMNPDGKNLE
jgi:hypothetical protein